MDAIMRQLCIFCDIIESALNTVGRTSYYILNWKYVELFQYIHYSNSTLSTTQAL